MPYVPAPPFVSFPASTSGSAPPLSDMARTGPVPIRGLDLRHAALVVLDRRRGEACTIPEMLEDLAVLGVCPDSARPRKALADALRWEVARGRVERVALGVYAIGYLPRTTRWRAAKAVRVAVEARRSAVMGGPGAHDVPLVVPALSDVARDHLDLEATAWSVLQRRR